MSGLRRRRSAGTESTFELVLQALASASPYPDRVRTLGPFDDLTPAALDSLGLVSMIATLEEHLSIDLSDAVPELRAAATPADLVRIVDHARSGRASGA